MRRYDKVIDIPNSMTVLPELLPMSVEMARRKLTGIMNFTNPGAISHNEILQLYKDYVDSEFTWWVGADCLLGVLLGAVG